MDLNLRVKTLEENIAETLERNTDLLAKPKLETDEETIIDGNLAEVKKLQTDLARVKSQQEELVRAASFAAGAAADTGELGLSDAKNIERFSYTRAIQSEILKRPQSGIEAEVQEQAIQDARRAGVTITGIGIPSMMFKPKSRALDVATEGTDTVQTTIRDLIPALRPSLVVEMAGATMITGNTGNLQFPRKSATGSYAWEGETDAGAAVTPTFDNISLSPNRLGGYTDYSKQFFFQTDAFQSDQMVTRNLEQNIGEGVDDAAIEGNGTNEPTGVTTTAGIGSVAIGTNGGAPTYTHVIDLETDITTANAFRGKMGYVSTPGVIGKLKTTLLDAGSGQFVLWQDQRELNGHPYFSSTLVPSDLTKGTGTALHAIIFGNWEEMIVANWAGVDIVVDIYTLAANAQVRILANSWWDVGIQHPLSFSAVLDADIS